MSGGISGRHTESAPASRGSARLLLSFCSACDRPHNKLAQNVNSAEAEKHWAGLLPASPLPGKHSTVIVKWTQLVFYLLDWNTFPFSVVEKISFQCEKLDWKV